MAIIAQLSAYGKRALERVPEGLLAALVLVFSCSASFGLGYLASNENRGGELKIEERPMEAALPAAAVVAVQAEAPKAAPEPALNAGGQYVASKNGTRYYLPWCGGVKNIKEENKVWFSSKAAAEAAGYTPAAACKGI